MKSPPAAATAEGLSIAVGAIAGFLYADGRARGNAEWLLVPRATIEHSISALIDWLDLYDGDPDLEPNGDDEPEEGL